MTKYTSSKGTSLLSVAAIVLCAMTAHYRVIDGALNANARFSNVRQTLFSRSRDAEGGILPPRPAKAGAYGKYGNAVPL